MLCGIAVTYINVLRGTPLFPQIYIAFFGFPMIGLNVPNLPLGVGVLAINCSAYLAEIFRAGIESVPPGQSEAAYSLGMTWSQVMSRIVIPQAVRCVIPTMTSEFVMLYKDTSLLSSVGVMGHGTHAVLQRPHGHHGQHYALHLRRTLLSGRDDSAHPRRHQGGAPSRRPQQALTAHT